MPLLTFKPDADQVGDIVEFSSSYPERQPLTLTKVGKAADIVIGAVMVIGAGLGLRHAMGRKGLPHQGRST
jgi:hypothetical protein